MRRPNWNEYFMMLAQITARRSTCDRASVGCVLVRDHNILGTGYNGSVAGMTHCDQAGHIMAGGHCIRTIHAELNAILMCARNGNSTNGAIAYITHFPCYDCAKVLANAGIVEIYYCLAYNNNPFSNDLFKSLNIMTTMMEIKHEEIFGSN